MTIFLESLYFDVCEFLKIPRVRSNKFPFLVELSQINDRLYFNDDKTITLIIFMVLETNWQFLMDSYFLMTS
ncbi:hypothetical protein BpHYR1_002683 [Brachionus plicatilis]|uniref:Uncharacterized protein n=1 Tax=Brachionus plicatilis TaxID=10195 RepID=A0A3M7PME7_BRAPC|nr:hypothetical protein BpHYR1_002683 [Brachionus plicatilis]